MVFRQRNARGRTIFASVKGKSFELGRGKVEPTLGVFGLARLSQLARVFDFFRVRVGDFSWE
jgi:hypothetical protein